MQQKRSKILQFALQQQWKMSDRAALIAIFVIENTEHLRAVIIKKYITLKKGATFNTPI